jgi:glycosyltransferase involved in cell wall biosynthesis
MSHITDSPPAISVIMPVCNCENYVAGAIESILNQSFTDFEFIIIEDGSTDKSLEVIQLYKDKRIILEKNVTRRGCYYCRNLGISMVRGKYICGMDADDISAPERFQRQYKFMEENPETGICGSSHRIFPGGFISQFITDLEQLKVAFLANNYCSHPSLIMRKEFLDKYNLRYNEEYYFAADFDFCSRAFRFFTVQNIPDVLYHYRRHPGQISTAHSNQQSDYADMIRINQLVNFLDFNPEEIPVLLHLKLMKRHPLSIRYKGKAEQWSLRILERNKTIGYYNQEILEKFLAFSINCSFKPSVVFQENLR